MHFICLTFSCHLHGGHIDSIPVGGAGRRGGGAVAVRVSVGLGHAVRAVGRAVRSVQDAALHVVLGRRDLAVVVLPEQTVMRVRLLALGAGAWNWW